MNNLINKTKVVFYGIILIVVIIASVILYSYFTFDSSQVAKNPILETKFFTILNTFKKDNINFTEIANVLNKVFDNLSDTHSEIQAVNQKGRINPFAP